LLPSFSIQRFEIQGITIALAAPENNELVCNAHENVKPYSCSAKTARSPALSLPVFAGFARFASFSIRDRSLTKPDDAAMIRA
jgi:hypothetical protein